MYLEITCHQKYQVTGVYLSPEESGNLSKLVTRNITDLQLPFNQKFQVTGINLLPEL